MKKLLVSLACLVLAIGSAFAQEETASTYDWKANPSSLSVSFGPQSLWGLIENGTNARSFGTYSLRYDYNVLKWLAVGGRATYEGATYKRSDVDRIYHKANVAMEVLFTYVNREHLQLYSGVSMGLIYRWDGAMDAKLDFKPMLPCASVIPIGLHVGGEHVYGLAEVSLGSEAVMNLGLGVRF